MDVIFHEKQEGSLCAQHCLNALLQGEYFTAVDLATLAHEMDEVERQRMAEGGTHSEEYQRFIQQPSSNMDDSGYFSIQVIASALKVWNLDLVPYNSQDSLAVMAQQNILSMKAFICNYRDHWFAIRKLGQQWFNLNSLLTGPELISDTYLSMVLAQLQQEGYSIFIVRGILPESEADELLRLTPAVQTVKPRLLSEVRGGGGSKTSVNSGSSQEVEDDIQLQEALRISKEEELADYENSQIQAALKKSIYDGRIPSGVSSEAGQAASSVPGPADVEDIRQRRLAYLSRTSGVEVACRNGEVASEVPPTKHLHEMTEEEMLEAAMKLSMDPA